MSDKDIELIELRRSAYGYAQELTLAANQGSFGSATGSPTLPDTKGVIEHAKLIYNYFTKGE